MLSLALPPGTNPTIRWHSTARAHESFLRSAGRHEGVRRVVLESWQRSRTYGVDPDHHEPPIVLTGDALVEARTSHALRLVLPVARRLLVEDAAHAGFVVVVGDSHARILWAEGDQSLLRKAEQVNLVPGARWREGDIGTSAIGTALALGEPAQVFGSEHFVRRLQTWSGTAAAIRDPRSDDILGFLSILGGPEAALPHAALLVRSTAAAIEAELRIGHWREGWLAGSGHVRANSGNRLEVLGRDRGKLTLDGRPTELSLRHTELLLLLSAHPGGLSAGDLLWQMYEHDAAEVTVRAEMSRLRRIAPSLVSASGRYTLRQALHTDAAEVMECLTEGHYEQALELYAGEVLPRSVAPGVVAMRYRLRGWLQNALLRHGTVHSLSRYAHSSTGRDDVQVWRTLLERLPVGSPQRAEAAAALADLDGSLGA